MMDMDKKKIIVKEIEQWRRSKLLPEHYCDFLLNLYLDDHSRSGGSSVLGVSSGQIRNSNWKIWLLGWAVVCVISFLALNFNSFELPMQMAVSIAFVAGCYGLGMKLRNRLPLVAYACLGAGSIFLLFIGVYLLNNQQVDAFGWYAAYTALCSLIWIGLGFALRLPVFQLCGWVCLTFIYALILNRFVGMGWGALQLSWLPVSSLFIWFGWLLHRTIKPVGIVLLLTGLLQWFMPELTGFYSLGLDEQGMQISLAVKAGIVAAVLFMSRKKWTEWVA